MSKQIEINWFEPEAFALAIQTAEDGARTMSEAQQKEADQQEAETKQERLNVLY